MDFGRFDKNRGLYIPQRYVGKPIMLEGATHHPFEGLDEISGCNNPDPVLCKIGDLTRNVQQGVLGITLVTPAPVKNYETTPLFSTLRETMPERTGGFFYVGSQNGEDFYMGRVGNQSMLQTMGSCEEDVTNRLDNLRNRASVLKAQHDNFLLQILDCPRGGIILETGCGKDYDRINQLRDYTESVRAKLICHDTVARTARLGAEAIPDTPFIILPPSSEILSLPLADLNKPITITLKDVVSSMAFSQITALCEVARNILAGKVIVTQSLMIAGESNMIPPSHGFNTINFAEYITQQAATHLPAIVKIRDSKFRETIVLYLSLQVRHTTELIMMELAKRTMFRDIKRIAHMGNAQIINVEGKHFFDTQEAKEYLSRFYPEFLTAFLQGEFNKISSGPFGVYLDQDSSIKNGLELQNIRSHWEFSRGRLSDPKSRKTKSALDISVHNIEEIAIPRKYVTTSKTFNTLEFNTQVPGYDFSRLHNATDQELKKITKAGAQIGFEMVFNFWGRHFQHPGITPFLNTATEKEIFKKLVQCI